MIKKITSKENAFVKQTQKLKTKKGRQKACEFILDGYRIVKHALEHDFSVSAVIVVDDFLDHHPIDFHGPIYQVTMAIMKLIVETDSPQGIVAIASIPEQELGDGPILYLDHVQDPGNLGTLIRTADAAGFGGVMLSKGCTDPLSQKSLRSSMGSILSIPVLINQDIEELKSLNYKIYGAALENGTPYKALGYIKEMVLIIGNEGNGISEGILELVDERVYIPMKGDVESLNASIAGGVLMFEIAACTS